MQKFFLTLIAAVAAIISVPSWADSQVYGSMTSSVFASGVVAQVQVGAPSGGYVLPNAISADAASHNGAVELRLAHGSAGLVNTSGFGTISFGASGAGQAFQTGNTAVATVQTAAGGGVSVFGNGYGGINMVSDGSATAATYHWLP